MSLLSGSQRQFLSAVSKLLYANPWLPEILNYEQEALGTEAVEEQALWSLTVSDPDRVRENSWRIVRKLEPMVDSLRAKLSTGFSGSEGDLILYEDALLYLFYYRYYGHFLRGASKNRWLFFREFGQDWDHYLAPFALPSRHRAAHIFACYYQVFRAFHQIFERVIGNSQPAARLRASIWQSIFTHDIRRYRRTLYSRMGEFSTLIMGPSGTGKELVARAIALSRYVPFDEKALAFADDATSHFYPINIAALPGTLVESELFGHKRGSFTGAVQDKRGWLEACPPLGAVFLDEIGELDPEIQVKLLRVIETRQFQPLGESGRAARRFEGKLIAATNRDLAAAIRRRRFREDLYYRLCSDQISTPSLRQQIEESPGVVGELVLFMARRVAGDEAETLAKEAQQWIETRMDPHYAWPGNYRELEQCVRNILVRKEYTPARPGPKDSDPFRDARAGTLTADQLISRYCKLVYSVTGSYVETARRLALDRRTVKVKITQ